MRQLRRLTKSEVNEETGQRYGGDVPEGMYWTADDPAKTARGYCGWKSKGELGPVVSDVWRRESAEHWIASIPAYHGSKFRIAALNCYDFAGLSTGPIQRTTHAAGVQRMLQRLDPQTFAEYLPGYGFASEGGHPVLTLDGEVCDQVHFRSLDFARLVYRLSIECGEWIAVVYQEMLNFLAVIRRTFGERYCADLGRLALAHDLGCNRGPTGAHDAIVHGQYRVRGRIFNLTAKLGDAENRSAEEVRDYLIQVRYPDGGRLLAASRIEYTYDAAQEAP